MKKQGSQQKILVGAHTSTAGGLENALFEGKEIGATTVQIFTSNQKQWKGRVITDGIIANWKKALEETQITDVMSHDSYLINLGSPNPEGLLKSRQAFHEEVVRCIQLGIPYLNFHPGSALDGTEEQCLDLIVESLLMQAPLLQNDSLRLLLETTAGQGSCVGCQFEQLAYILDKIKDKIPVGVCIDTCHIFVSGYDLRTREACEKTFQEFDRIVGLNHLYAFHLNDSSKELGSRVDRHKPLGEGTIGWECFKFIMQDERTKFLPKYLETPEGPPGWTKEIAKLKEFATS